MCSVLTILTLYHHTIAHKIQNTIQPQTHTPKRHNIRRISATISCDVSLVQLGQRFTLLAAHVFQVSIQTAGDVQGLLQIISELGRNVRIVLCDLFSLEQVFNNELDRSIWN